MVQLCYSSLSSFATRLYPPPDPRFFSASILIFIQPQHPPLTSLQTTVAIGVTFVHLNPQVYTDPETFRPERWLEDGADALENGYFVPFSKGSRMCLGHKCAIILCYETMAFVPHPFVSLAWCEMYLALASIFRKTTIRIHDTRCVYHGAFSIS